MIMKTGWVLAVAGLVGVVGATPMPKFSDAPAGEKEIRCSVPAGDGVCLSVFRVGRNSAGTFHLGAHAPWPCPGGGDIQCWVPDSHDDVDDDADDDADDDTDDDTDETPEPPTTTTKPPAKTTKPPTKTTKPPTKTTKPPTKTPKPATGGRSGGNGRINQNSIDLLKELEGFVPGVYNDPVGIATIGYGHNCEAHPGTCEGLKIPLSKADGEKLMIGDLTGFENCVCALPNAKQLNVNEFGALVSFAYNSGCGGVANHWKSYMTRKDFDGICDDFPTTNTLKGLLTPRRTKEQKLCREATTVMSGC